MCKVHTHMKHLTQNAWRAAPVMVGYGEAGGAVNTVRAWGLRQSNVMADSSVLEEPHEIHHSVPVL